MSIFGFLKDLFTGKLFQKDENSVTVTGVRMLSDLCFEKKDCYCFSSDCKVEVSGTRHEKSKKGEYKFVLTCVFKKGFTSDGASAPDFAKKWVPSVKEGNDLYNIAPFIHDGLYGLKGTVDGADFTRDECDDILRGIWRESGMDRAIAGAADVGIHLVAGSDDHWGGDVEKTKAFFSAKFRKV